MVQGDPPLPSYAAEQEVLGFDHTQVGAELAQSWHLPAMLVAAIAHHHHPFDEAEFPREVAIIYIANTIASLPYSDIPDEVDLQRVDARAWDQAGLSPDCLADCVRQAQAHIVETTALLFETQAASE
jgi:HD-like signal output (HDOD) protein